MKYNKKLPKSHDNQLKWLQIQVIKVFPIDKIYSLEIVFNPAIKNLSGKEVSVSLESLNLFPSFTLSLRLLNSLPVLFPKVSNYPPHQYHPKTQTQSTIPKRVEKKKKAFLIQRSFSKT